jgi:hypothetical protein
VNGQGDALSTGRHKRLAAFCARPCFICVLLACKKRSLLRFLFVSLALFGLGRATKRFEWRKTGQKRRTGIDWTVLEERGKDEGKMQRRDLRGGGGTQTSLSCCDWLIQLLCGAF